MSARRRARRRLAQRIGRANHRMDEPSRAILVPANRFEVMECQAALDASYLGAQDTPPVGEGTLDVLAQHVLGMACAAPFDEDALYAEVISAAPYARLAREDFDRIVDFVATGGYALKAYERYARIRKTKDGLWRIANPQVAQQYRLNVGTIVEMPMLNVRMVSRGVRRCRSAAAGACSARWRNISSRMLAPGDTFLFAGKILRFEGIRENECLRLPRPPPTPKVPAYAGGKFPLSTYLADGQVRGLLADAERWKPRCPNRCADWLRLQTPTSPVLPAATSF
jgi:ATP-dependent Lhr-like helicase